MGPNTQDAIRRFQADKNLPQTGTLDSATMNALGIKRNEALIVSQCGGSSGRRSR